MTQQWKPLVEPFGQRQSGIYSALSAAYIESYATQPLPCLNTRLTAAKTHSKGQHALVSTVAVTLASSVALSSNAQANPEFYGADDTPDTALCLAITKDHPRSLRNEMQNYHINRYTMQRKLSCNNLTVQEFASLYGFERSLNTLGIAPMTNTSIKDLAKRVDTNNYVLVGSR